MKKKNSYLVLVLSVELAVVSIYTNAKDSARKSDIILKFFQVIHSVLDSNQDIILRVSFSHLMESIPKPPIAWQSPHQPKYVSLRKHLSVGHCLSTPWGYAKEKSRNFWHTAFFLSIQSETEWERKELFFLFRQVSCPGDPIPLIWALLALKKKNPNIEF